MRSASEGFAICSTIVSIITEMAFFSLFLPAHSGATFTWQAFFFFHGPLLAAVGAWWFDQRTSRKERLRISE